MFHFANNLTRNNILSLQIVILELCAPTISLFFKQNDKV